MDRQAVISLIVSVVIGTVALRITMESVYFMQRWAATTVA
jgi:uncharacterized membrane-anchored protein YhcB (DUF1043 family)